MVETLHARGHPNVLGTHKMTFEVTRDSQLSKRGNCVIGVSANKAANDLDFGFKEACRREGARIMVRLEAEGIIETIHGLGSCGLSFSHPKEIVGRKSMYASDRTIMVSCDKAAFDLDRQLISAMKSSNTKLNVQIIVDV
ncbi:MAG TPA: DUF371 domain-containing protein [archaeon]|nr:DUF371 domain-containing protein [archaeon]